jgi:primosomal protein N' (replication factor Y)
VPEFEHTARTQKRVTHFADVLLPVPIPQYYTYRIPEAWNHEVTIGKRVIVQFGPKKILTGIVVNVHQIPPSTHEAKYIQDVLDQEPVLNTLQLNLFRWMAKYYMCAEGQVLQVALPSGLKLSSQSRIQLHPEFDQETSPYPLDDREIVLLQALEQEGTLDYSQATEKIGSKNLHKIIKSLLTKKAILLFEEVKEKYHPKKEKRVRLHSAYVSNKALEEQFDLLQKKPKQTEVLLKYLQHVQVLKNPEINQQGMEKAQLLSAGISASSLKTLVKNKVFEEFEVIVSRLPSSKTSIEEASGIELTPQQTASRNDILTSFEKNKTVLFHGVTGSGKTEIYIDLILQVLNNGQQVLYLLPEIALTTQIVGRLHKIFGDAMGVYHSRFSDNERVEVWRGILEGKFSFIVGVRSSIFLPFDNLGLIIVDEEHELSYKQFDPAPR